MFEKVQKPEVETFSISAVLAVDIKYFNLFGHIPLKRYTIDNVKRIGLGAFFCPTEIPV